MDPTFANMDLVVIPAKCVSLIGIASSLQTRCFVLLSESRRSYRDMKMTVSELTSLQLCLQVLRDDEEKRKVVCPFDLEDQVQKIPAHCEYTLQSLGSLMVSVKYRRGPLGCLAVT